MNATQLITLAREKGATDVFLIAGQPLSLKISGEITPVRDAPLSPEDARSVLEEAYALRGRSKRRLEETGDDDFALSLEGARLRINAFRQRGGSGAVMRLVSDEIPDPEKIGIPSPVLDCARQKKGLVLVTGPAGSGKSTTLACMIQRVNETSAKHIITIEDPVEYVYHSGRSLVTQREVGSDTEDYTTALRASLRQSPDLILVGEMRDYDTIRTALTAAETGHLILSTLHTLGAGNTVNRIIDIFPPDQQQQVRMQLASQLHSVVTQQLVRTLDGTVVPVFEVVHITGALQNMIRENKTHQMGTSISLSSGDDTMSMDGQLMDLWKQGRITQDTAVAYALRPDMLKKRMKEAGGRPGPSKSRSFFG